jgi:hypothetical protein
VPPSPKPWNPKVCSHEHPGRSASQGAGTRDTNAPLTYPRLDASTFQITSCLGFPLFLVKSKLEASIQHTIKVQMSTTVHLMPAEGVGSLQATSSHESLPIITVSEPEERGRLKRRRQSSLSPRRARSPSRGHDRTSGSRYREHHRKHHRPSSPSSSISPPTVAQKKTRRRSDAEPDHTFRGRVRNRSGSQRGTRSPISEGEDDEAESLRTVRRRSQPPSRHKIDEEDDESAELRRQRSYRKLHEARRDSKGEPQLVGGMDAAQAGTGHTGQPV